MNFHPGQALANKQAWERVISNLKNQDIIIPKFVDTAIEEGALDLLHPDVYSGKDFYYVNKGKDKNKIKKGVYFNNCHYDSYEELIDNYKNRKNPNY